MGAVELGGKHSCQSCRCRFYDLGRESPTCPKCGGSPAVKTIKLKAGRKAKKKKAELFTESVRGTGESFDEFFDDEPIELTDDDDPDESVDEP